MIIGGDSPKPGGVRERLLAAGRSPLALVLEKALGRHGGPTPRSPGTSILAVSGGGDSLPMLWLGAAIAQREDSPGFVVAHVDHGLRPEAVDEAAMVEDHAAAAGLDCVVRRIDCSGTGNRAAIARRRREEALLEVARERDAGIVVTAHHADDQLETVIAAIARGAGPRGWRGIHRSRPLEAGIRLIRPFLGVPRMALRTLGAELGLTPAEDPTNTDPRRLRGRLRRGVCAELEAIFPGAAVRVAAAADQAELAELAIDRWLDEVWGDGEVASWSRRQLQGLPAALIAAGLRRFLKAQAPELVDRVTAAMGREIAEAVGDAEQAPRQWMWPGGMRVELTSARLRIRPGSGDRTTGRDRIQPPPGASPRR